MAFKTAEQIAATKARETRFTLDDARFRGKDIVSVEVDLTLENNRMGLSTILLTAYPESSELPEKVWIELSNTRHEVFMESELRCELEDIAIHAGANPDLQARRITVTFDGFWEKRNIKGAHRWITCHHLVAARWKTKIDGIEYIEGALPDFS